jgi:hypothetical protein
MPRRLVDRRINVHAAPRGATAAGGGDTFELRPLYSSHANSAQLKPGTSELMTFSLPLSTTSFRPLGARGSSMIFIDPSA